MNAQAPLRGKLVHLPLVGSSPSLSVLHEYLRSGAENLHAASNPCSPLDELLHSSTAQSLVRRWSSSYRHGHAGSLSTDPLLAFSRPGGISHCRLRKQSSVSCFYPLTAASIRQFCCCLFQTLFRPRDTDPVEQAGYLVLLDSIIVLRLSFLILAVVALWRLGESLISRQGASAPRIHKASTRLRLHVSMLHLLQSSQEPSFCPCCEIPHLYLRNQ